MAGTVEQKLTAQGITLPEPRTSPDIDSDLQAPRVHRGGTA